MMRWKRKQKPVHVFTASDVLFQLPGVKVSHFTDDYDLKEVGLVTLAFSLSKLLCCWKWVHMTMSLLILPLSTGCPLIHEYSANLRLRAMTASTRPLLAT